MGRSTRWLLSLIGLKKSSKSSKPSLNGGAEDVRRSTKEKRRWSFGKSLTQGSFENSASRSDYEQEQTKHAIKVAAASAVAAEAAVAAAQAAAAVVRLTGGIHHPPLFELISREEWAAIKIQTAFRACLARRALRALRAVVRIQALFRGHRVRKQAAITLRCMQALVRVQARVRARRVRMSQEGQAVQEQLLQRRLKEQGRSRKSVDGWNASTGTVEDLNAQNERRHQGFMKRERALAYAFSKSQDNASLVIDCEPDTPHWGWSWLERWMAARPWESPFENAPGGGQTSPTSQNTKIVEVDPAAAASNKQVVVKKLQKRSSMKAAAASVSPPQAYNDYATPVPLPAKPVEQTSFDMSHPSPAEYHSGRTDRDFLLDDNIWSTNAATGKSSPGFVLKQLKNFGEHSVSRDESDLLTHPSYMATTQSSKAKVRSHSTPKQRPDATPDTPRGGRRSSLPLGGGLESRSTNSGSLRSLQKNSHLRLSGKNFSGSVVLDRSLVSLMSANGDLRKPFRF